MFCLLCLLVPTLLVVNLQTADCAPAKSHLILPPIPGYIPVYIQLGDVPPDEPQEYAELFQAVGDRVFSHQRNTDLEPNKATTRTTTVDNGGQHGQHHETSKDRLKQTKMSSSFPDKDRVTDSSQDVTHDESEQDGVHRTRPNEHVKPGKQTEELKQTSDAIESLGQSSVHNDGTFDSNHKYTIHPVLQPQNIIATMSKRVKFEDSYAR